MSRHLHLAPRRNSVPVPIIPENTTYFEAGPIVFGVEYREINERQFAHHMANTPGAAEAWANRAWADDPELNGVLQFGFGVDGQTAPEMDGVTIHVLDSETSAEYLRFDAFSDQPHYHYLLPGDYHVVVFFDDIAEPDFLGWIFERLRSRLAAMLADVGAQTLAAQVESSKEDVLHALPAVEERAREVLRADKSGFRRFTAV